MNPTSRHYFLRLILMSWLVICLSVFIIISRNGFVQIVSITNWQAFLDMLTRIPPMLFAYKLLGALLGVMIFSLSCTSLGFFFLHKITLTGSSTMAWGVTAFLLGEIFYSLIFLTVIGLYRLTPSFVLGCLLTGFLAGLRPLQIFIALISPPSRLTTAFQRSERIILALTLIILFFCLFLAFTRLGYDAAAEYFSHAKIMAVTQLPVFFYPNEYFVVSSFHPGILFTAIIQLFSDQAARMLSWVNGIAILLIGLAIGQELGLTSRARLWFLVLMVTTTAFIDLLGDGKIELISTAPILASIYWLIWSVEHPARGTYVLAGVLSGFAIISRPYNIFLVSLFIALFLTSSAIIQYRSGRFSLKQFIRPILWLVLPLLAMGTFHLLQNWIWLRSPIAPLTYARGLDNADWQWVVDPAYLTFYRLLYPFTLTFLNSQQSLGNISPLLVGLLPFLLLAEVRMHIEFSTLSKQLLLVTILTLLAWITISFTVLEIRYVMFLWVLLFLLTAQVIENVLRHGGIQPVRYLLIIFLAIICARTVVIAITTYLPQDNQVQPYCPDSNLCKFMDTLNKNAGPGERVFVLHAYRYYLRPDLFACSSQVDEYYPLQELARQDPQEFWEALYRQGFRYIMYEQHLSEQRFHFGKLPPVDTAPGWMRIETLYSNPGATQVIYSLEAAAPPARPDTSCIQNTAGMWQVSSNATRP